MILFAIGVNPNELRGYNLLRRKDVELLESCGAVACVGRDRQASFSGRDGEAEAMLTAAEQILLAKAGDGAGSEGSTPVQTVSA